ncbi:MAG: HD domain-containing phosphohydrolase, partial [Vicinamibacterales bacterium]
GAVTVIHSLVTLYGSPIGSQWLVLAGLTLLTGSFTVKVPAVNAHISVSETFVFAAVLLFGPAAGAITVLLECLVILFWMKPQGRPAHRVLFNLAAPAVSIWLSGQAFFLTSGIAPYAPDATPLPTLFLPLFLFTSLYFLLNSGLVAGVVALETGKPALQVWWQNFTWLSVTYFSGASVAALIVTYTRDLDLSALAIMVPLLVVMYLTFRTAMGRVDDTNKHLTELNRLYLSTIETLAMAIDAKDQITHGHIRRVQTYAVGLARRVGVSDEKLIRAIEAAALLHDMGKLAVPEYILNKPGRLTGAEFEKMKVHASVGADILSAIDFPYPVVPIVRHHHENWDGSGYPANLRGTDIPIGARILSVVDCFDALTSDRPYRPKLTDDDAIAILLQRRGSMYDPLIVDTFIRVHAEIAPDAKESAAATVIKDIAMAAAQMREVDQQTAGFENIAAGSDEMATLFELASALNAQATLSQNVEAVTTRIRRLVPFVLAVHFAYDDASDELVAAHAVGEGALLVTGMRIAPGQRLSGWVAANRQSIMNSDAMLDLGEIARGVAPRLRSCLSTPLLAHDQLVGVLTLYSATSDGFTEDHRRILEVAGRYLAAVSRWAPPTQGRASATDRRPKALPPGEGQSRIH